MAVFAGVHKHAWRGVGYGSIVYVASISGISQEYYEAAVLDGASKYQQARYVTLPHLKKIIVIMLILNIGTLLRGDFGLFYNVTQNNGRLYEEVRSVAPEGMPIVFHECGSIPTEEQMRAENAPWLMFMVWHTDFITDGQSNTPESLREIYQSDYFITLDELPSFR